MPKKTAITQLVLLVLETVEVHFIWGLETPSRNISEKPKE